jgi:3D (Asp-Asp-Asp) domain-containing protein
MGRQDSPPQHLRTLHTSLRLLLEPEKVKLAATILLLLLPSTVSTDSWDWWGRWTVTAYSHGCVKPKNGKEHNHPHKGANNKWPIANLTIAADRSIPFDTAIEFSYRGVQSVRIVGDRGRAIKGRRIDLFVDSCPTARQWGIRTLYGKIVGKISHP